MYYTCYSHSNNCYGPNVSTYILKGKGRHLQHHNIVTWNLDLINFMSLKLFLYGHHYVDLSIHFLFLDLFFPTM